MKFYVISFDTDAFKLKAEVTKIDSTLGDIYDELSSLIESDSLEFVDYNNEIVIIIDEQGKCKKGNPMFRIVTEDGITLDLAGKILFARNIENDFSTDIGSIKHEDIFNLRLNLDIKLIGMITGGL
ncbi:hypothetical protein [Solibacillus isronensis]|uniref:hypothetical protein n=1 Tax=Solibacillus isronensis TaxID=412383 RepID=UPI00203BA32C|nr:hypothetical protein [Solibacillus isronensis]MCM3723975.1 hypothetical protein [Solibacillus isronensis]